VSFPPPCTTDEVDMLYCQLVEIHAIDTTQLAECARWRHSASTSSPVRARTDRQRLDEIPSVIRMAAPPLVNFSP
jgi:hypothetical protein